MYNHIRPSFPLHKTVSVTEALLLWDCMSYGKLAIVLIAGH